MNYQIIASRGHYEVYVNGDLYCTADTIKEAEREIEEYEAEHAVVMI